MRDATEDTRHILGHHTTRELVLVTSDGIEEVVSAYLPAHLMDALDCLIRGYWGECGVAELVRDNIAMYEELPEGCYGDELDNLAAFLNCM